jgi:hypothetical protein
VLIPNFTSKNVKAMLVNFKVSLLQWTLILKQLQVMVLLFCGFIFLLLLKILISFVEGHGHGG